MRTAASYNPATDNPFTFARTAITEFFMLDPDWDVEEIAQLMFALGVICGDVGTRAAAFHVTEDPKLLRALDELPDLVPGTVDVLIDRFFGANTEEAFVLAPLIDAIVIPALAHVNAGLEAYGKELARRETVDRAQ